MASRTSAERVPFGLFKPACSASHTPGLAFSGMGVLKLLVAVPAHPGAPNRSTSIAACPELSCPLSMKTFAYVITICPPVTVMHWLAVTKLEPPASKAPEAAESNAVPDVPAFRESRGSQVSDAPVSACQLATLLSKVALATNVCWQSATPSPFKSAHPSTVAIVGGWTTSPPAPPSESEFAPAPLDP